MAAGPSSPAGSARLNAPVRLRLPIAAVLAVAGAFALAGPALADNLTSANWSGYAVHAPGAHFTDISGRWRVPAVNCRSGNTAYSAMWIGLGGFSATSYVLEQTGTEADCDGYDAVYYAWYELVPAPSRTLALRIHAGDLMRAEVKVHGHRVTLTLDDLTHHRSFSRTFTPATVDTSSAEWILEAPGDCSGSKCVTLPLADFGRAFFSAAHVVNARGHGGGIAAAQWRMTRITLRSAGPQPTDAGDPRGSDGASPGALRAAGRAFTLNYTGAAALRVALRAALVPGQRLLH